MTQEYLKPRITRADELRFTPYAWAKLLYLRDKGQTEVGGYGICGTSDPLLITDFCLIKQECTSASVELDENDSTRFVEEMTDAGLSPWQYSYWIHTHPGTSPHPSPKDEEIFNKYFSKCHWTVFFILAKGGDSYCRVRHNVGPGIECTLESTIDFGVSFPASNRTEWDKEYKEKVFEKKVEYHVFDNQNVIQQNFPDQDDDDEVDENDFMEKNGDFYYWDDKTGECFLYVPESEKFYDMRGTAVFYNPNKAWMRKMKLWARASLVNVEDTTLLTGDEDDFVFERSFE